MANSGDQPRDYLASIVVAGATLRQQSKKHRIGAGPLNVLLTIHLLNDDGWGIAARQLAEASLCSSSLLRSYVRQLEARGYLKRYHLHLSRAPRRLCLTATGKTLVGQLLRAMRTAANEVKSIAP
jgi:DNA-binding MarR family transcriptional regulator